MKGWKAGGADGRGSVIYTSIRQPVGPASNYDDSTSYLASSICESNRLCKQVMIITIAPPCCIAIVVIRNGCMHCVAPLHAQKEHFACNVLSITWTGRISPVLMSLPT